MRTAIALATIVLSLTLTSPPVRAGEWPSIPARLSLNEGEVLVQTPESPDWIPASSNLPLGPGDRVWVGVGGKTEIQLPEGNVVRLGSDTSLDLRSLSFSRASEVRVGLERGMATFYILRLQPEINVFQVDLPHATLRAFMPSTFRSDLFPDGSMQVSVHSGEVVVETPGGVTKVHGRQSLRLSPDLTPHLYALAQGDDFDRWNRLRDLQLSRPVHPAHLPPELAAHAPEFGAYGRWVEAPDHGYGWAPVVEAGWTPFSEGRWIWWREEHVWISDEPWGWVPYHYGRWRFYPAVGWIWVPPVASAIVWHPGAVAWHYGPEFVAWIPLAPGEIYYGHRHYGPWSVNITNVHVNTVHVTNVFVNARAPKAVVVVPRERFVTGGRAPASFVAPRDLFASGGHRSLGPPALRPTMAARRPALSHSITTSEVQPPAIGRSVRGIGATPRTADTNRSPASPGLLPRRVVPDTVRVVSAPATPIRPVERSGVGARRTEVATPPIPGRSNGAVTPRRGIEGGQFRSTPTMQSPATTSHVAPGRQVNPDRNSRRAEVASSRTPRGGSAFQVREGGR